MTPSEKQAMGKRIKDLRIERGLRQRQCLDGLGGITIQMLSGWETGNVTPSLDYLGKIAEFYNTTLDYIILGKKKDKSDRTIYTYKDAIESIYYLIENNLFELRYNQGGLEETTIYTFDKTIAEFFKEFNAVDNAKKSMRPELFRQIISDLMDKYDFALEIK